MAVMETLIIIKGAVELGNEIYASVKEATDKFGDEVTVEQAKGLRNRWKSSDEIEEEIENA